MAAVTHRSDVVVRAALAGEGRNVAALWRELWDAHEGWGGYPGLHDTTTYEQLAVRLEHDARVRAGLPILGRHIHLVAVYRGEICGQVEGWFERHGIEPSTPYTCEVRSLIVRQGFRNLGVGRALLDKLLSIALELSRGGPVVLAAEVLEPNPAHSFYEALGYKAVSWTTRIDASLGPAAVKGYDSRLGEPRDALSIAMYETALAMRRRAGGDWRFDRPRAVDATFVGAIAEHLAQNARGIGDPLELVVVDARGHVRGAGSFAINALEPPFVPAKRAMVGRFAIDPALACDPILHSAISYSCRLASGRGARHVELTDLTAPGTPLYESTIACGAIAWSRVVVRRAGAAS